MIRISVIGAVAIITTTAGIATAESQTIVSGQSDLWLAGMPDGSTASSGDSAPNQSPVLVEGITFGAGDILTFSAAGCVHHTPNIDLCDGPDGGDPFTHQGPINNISNLTTHLNAVIGVFLTDALPTDAPAPAPLTFVDDDLNYLMLAPELQQSFFIGDGMTDKGISQQVVVPPGATRLYLGTHDGFGWFNNVGEHVVTVMAGADVDADSDGVPDAVDNCVQAANPDQRDTNGDGFGNICDADLNDDLNINFADLGLLKDVFFSDDPDADFDGDGSVNFADLGIMKASFFGAPGPSGIAR